jgi:hypothetical protein
MESFAKNAERMLTWVEIGDVIKMNTMSKIRRKTKGPSKSRKISPIKNKSVATVSMMVEATMRIYKFLKTNMLATPKAAMSKDAITKIDPRMIILCSFLQQSQILKKVIQNLHKILIIYHL